jgi:hypothetical protein
LLLCPRQSRDITKEGHGRGKVFTSWKPGNKESNRKGPRPRYTAQRYTSSAALTPNRLHLPQFYHIPIVYSSFALINSLNHCLGQNLHCQINYPKEFTDMPKGALLIWLFLNSNKQRIKINHHIVLNYLVGTLPQ